jgi:hypothetical protein
MPLSADEQRVLAAIADELNREDPQLVELLARCPPPLMTQQTRRRLGARWAAVPLALGMWALIAALATVSGVGLADAALIVVALGMLVGVHGAKFLARRALYRRFAADARPDRYHRED